ncbi:flavodoxin I [Natronobacillus azotifigens]|uniref:Flavodoxin domain-containing protein n=1 Tax=Natronobacillus azotifigens TaxID=472978 RepID=A0A9J6RB11_9BACI|nr:flavodoxin domain-containing protein [Natronobacillus azotifigens]MCZ0702856.1 flavodoxin domain-containing protein [Natronobacillus azotifigens]
MKAAIIYSSITGNTVTLAEAIELEMRQNKIDVDLIPINELDYQQLSCYDTIVIGTYTWGNGDIPPEMDELFFTIETRDFQNVTTGVFGTGDSFYPYFCGAVDLFRDMLYVHTNLAVTLKVELLPQSEDLAKVKTFCQRLVTPLVTV